MVDLVNAKVILTGQEYAPYPGIKYELKPGVIVTLKRDTQDLVHDANELTKRLQEEQAARAGAEMSSGDQEEGSQEEGPAISKGGWENYLANFEDAKSIAKIMVEGAPNYDWRDASIQVVNAIGADFFTLVVPQRSAPKL